MHINTIIIGAGISGLVAAYQLKKRGQEIRLLESGNRAGGVISSQEVEGFLLERGPNSLRGTHELIDLVEELDLMEQLVTADPKAPAYVYYAGQLHAVPMNPLALAQTKLLTTGAKLRLLREPFVSGRREDGEESIASFVHRRLGPQILDRLVAPFLSGVYAGDAERLSVQATLGRLAEFEATAGSIVRGGFRAMRQARAGKVTPKRSLRPYRLCSFRNGLQTLPQALADSLSDHLLTDVSVTDITTLSQPSGYEVTFACRGERQTLQSDNLIIAAPAKAAAQMLSECAPEVATLVADIPYTQIIALPLAYRREQVGQALDGFGFLTPRSEGLRILGSIWNSSLFAGRAPEGWVLLNNFIGGETDPAAIELSDDELIGIAHADLKKVLKINGEPRRLPITRWQRAIPQYVIGHAGRMKNTEAALKNRRGLWLAGNYLRGISIGDCIRQAMQVADEVSRATD